MGIGNMYNTAYTYYPYKPFYFENRLVSPLTFGPFGNSIYLVRVHTVSVGTHIRCSFYSTAEPARHRRIHKYVCRVLYTHVYNTNQPHSVQRRPSPECYVATSPSPLDRPVLVRTLGGNAVKYSVSHSLTRYPSYPRGPLGILHYIYGITIMSL